MAESRRWPALDLAKFICISSMILVHMFIWFLLIPGGLNTEHKVYKFMSSFLFVALFNLAIPSTAGSTLRFYMGKGPRKIFFISLFIAILGYIMNPIAFGQRWAFSWNVLQFIALSFIVIALANYIHKYLIYLLAILSLVFITPIKDFFLNINNPYLNVVFIGNDSGLHLWPFFPWFITVVLGYLISDLYIRNGGSKKFTILLFLLGSVFFVLSSVSGGYMPSLNPKNVWGPSLFQPDIGVIFMVMSLYCFLMAFAGILSRKIKTRKYGMISSYSHGILWIYLALMIVGFRLMSYLKSIFGQDILVLIFMLIFMPLVLWLVGYISIRLLHDRKIKIFIRKTI